MAAVRDVVLASVLLFIFGMGFFVINFAAKTMVSSIVAIPVINQTENAVETFNYTSTNVDRLDYIIFGLFIGLILGIIVAGWFIAGNPLFMFIYFLVTVIGVIVSMGLANVWNDMTLASVFGSTITSFPITNHIITLLPMYTAVIGLLGIVVMFAKPYITRNL